MSSMRPKRSSDLSSADEEFKDPLKNYDKREYSDDLERSLAEDPVTAVQYRPFKGFTPDTPMGTVAQEMNKSNISCVMIIDRDDRLVGVFSDRDLLEKIGENYERLASRPVSQFMTADPLFVYETDPVAKAINLMSTGGFRHIPILDMNDKVAGIIGPRRMISYLQAFMPH